MLFFFYKLSINITFCATDGKFSLCLKVSTDVSNICANHVSVSVLWSRHLPINVKKNVPVYPFHSSVRGEIIESMLICLK